MALIVGGAVAVVGGVALLLFREPYGRMGGRAMARAFAVFGDSEEEWRGRYRSSKATFGRLYSSGSAWVRCLRRPRIAGAQSPSPTCRYPPVRRLASRGFRWSPLLGPAVWAPVAQQLAATGWSATIASGLRSAPRTPEGVIRSCCARRPTWTATLSLFSTATPAASSAVAHSRRVIATVLVDAALSLVEGAAPFTPPAFYEFLASRADDDGLLSPWTRWWDDADIATLFPGADVRASVEREQQRLLLAYFSQSLDVPGGWDEVPSSVLPGIRRTAADERDQAAVGDGRYARRRRPSSSARRAARGGCRDHRPAVELRRRADEPLGLRCERCATPRRPVLASQSLKVRTVSMSAGSPRRRTRRRSPSRMRTAMPVLLVAVRGLVHVGPDAPVEHHGVAGRPAVGRHRRDRAGVPSPRQPPHRGGRHQRLVDQRHDARAGRACRERAPDRRAATRPSRSASRR